ncbi:ABC transporter ATP-binding protein [Agathobacter rectalis]|jgi:ABC-2 type transport system ATP-binding protein|uniref:ABC transporter ATP-binding protein n=1 Tax=Agathobacter rectalis TaxID=39491 RepID=A0A413U8F5_9FIRM|nr:ABC transporter ATP-binding protein [Agathobacter rectalis]RHB06246.1 ABC transporter ATP-binding protein [Agathobacter rectalis]
MIQLQNVTKRIKENTVLDNVSYTFKSGFVYGLYGQNGSGKTMLLRAISGLINLDSGSIFIDGEKLHDKIEFPPETGIVIENMELLPECSAKRNLQMLAKIKNIVDEKDIIFSLERVGLDPDSDKKVKKFSLGMKQRLNIAQAIFENQKIILLDEPTNALDEDAVQLIYKIIREEKSRGATIIVATHHKEDLKEVCDVILKIAEGKIVEENENK